MLPLCVPNKKLRRQPKKKVNPLERNNTNYNNVPYFSFINLDKKLCFVDQKKIWVLILCSPWKRFIY
ncbi:hypothetical protein BDA99DRAFT_602886 [Phascolomyces articulosus]|uniref:Uncharacterized protein n=1 Tax=Phascolomyces articulosus TaxID=60185 RepID=A0AAD5K631_9FUNG|nr:hypothetical protein BDA99DRAFT_602886 [Phascolomyces articulosus]